MTDIVELLVQNIEARAEELRKGRFFSPDLINQMIEFARIIEEANGLSGGHKQRCLAAREVFSEQLDKAR